MGSASLKSLSLSRMSIPAGILRTVLRWIMLVALGIGTAATLYSIFDESSRFPMAAMITAVGGAALVIPARTVEKRKLRGASLIAFAVVLVEYLLLLASLLADSIPVVDASQKLYM